MAIINSIAIGKARGAIGNVIFQVYKKKTVARQRNLVITKQPTQAQIRQQNRVANIAAAYNWNSQFLTNFNKAAKKDGSVYNYFVKLAQAHASDNPVIGNYESWNSLRFRSYGDTKWISLDSIEGINAGVGAGGSLIKFHMTNWLIETAAFINYYCVDQESPTPYRLVRELTFEEITSGQIIIEPFENTNIEPSAYVTTDEGYVYSNLLIQ